MISVVQAKYLDGHRIKIEFSDGARGVFDAADLVNRTGPMVQPLRETGFFRDFFIELGALCWRNGFELSPGSLYRKLEGAGLLEKPRAVA